MIGQDEYGWQNRSWRIQENKSQVEADKWIFSGIGLGAIAAVFAARQGLLPQLVGRPVTRAIGSMGGAAGLGMVGQALWRNGVMGGKFPDGQVEGKGGKSLKEKVVETSDAAVPKELKGRR